MVRGTSRGLITRQWNSLWAPPPAVSLLGNCHKRLAEAPAEEGAEWVGLKRLGLTSVCSQSDDATR